MLKRVDTLLSGVSFFVPQRLCNSITPVSHPDISAFIRRHDFFSVEKPLVGHVTESEADIQTTAQLLKILPLVISDPDMRRLAEGEILSKILAYRELKVGMKINQYTVDRVFDLWKGMPAFGLVSDNASSLLLFRGTDFNLKTRRSWAAIWSDLDLKGPGYTVYQKARPDLRSWLKGKNAQVMGCSLGGAFVFYTVLFEGDLLSFSDPSLAYNPLGVFEKSFKLWESLNRKPSLITYVTTGDFIPKIGRLIGDVREISASRRLKPIEAHVKLMFAE